MEGKVYSTLTAGMETTVQVECGSEMMSSVVFGMVVYPVDTPVRLEAEGDSVALFDRETGRSPVFGPLKF